MQSKSTYADSANMEELKKPVNALNEEPKAFIEKLTYHEPYAELNTPMFRSGMEEQQSDDSPILGKRLHKQSLLARGSGVKQEDSFKSAHSHPGERSFGENCKVLPVNVQSS